MKLALVIGTRPEAIKMAPLALEARNSEDFSPLLISTGQHKELVKPILDLFDLNAEIDLDLMQPGQRLGDLAARAIKSLTEVLTDLKPDVLVVQGDTTTAMSAALAAHYLGIPVAHLEAGLRSDRLDAPFPEEANRRIISQVAHWHFAPTEKARENLYRDHLHSLGGHIIVTGNTVIDALHLALERINDLALDKLLPEQLASQLVQNERRMILITGHRRENFGEPFEEFCLGLKDLAEKFPEDVLVYPVHLNPNVQEPVNRLLRNIDNVYLLPPIDYPAFIALMKMAYIIITDSGGVQEEAPALGIPVLVTRDVTERPEGVEAGGVRLIGANRTALLAHASELLENLAAYTSMAQPRFSYGDGLAASRCLQALRIS